MKLNPEPKPYQILRSSDTFGIYGVVLPDYHEDKPLDVLHTAYEKAVLDEGLTIVNRLLFEDWFSTGEIPFNIEYINGLPVLVLDGVNLYEYSEEYCMDEGEKFDEWETLSLE